MSFVRNGAKQVTFYLQAQMELGPDFILFTRVFDDNGFKIYI